MKRLRIPRSQLDTVYTYLRVGQTDLNKIEALAAQRTELAAYCVHHDYRLLAEYSDVGSGADPLRPGYTQMLADMRAQPQVGHVLVTRLDRLCRCMRAGLPFMEGHELFDLSLLVSDEPAFALRDLPLILAANETAHHYGKAN